MSKSVKAISMQIISSIHKLPEPTIDEQMEICSSMVWNSEYEVHEPLICQGLHNVVKTSLLKRLL